MPDDSLLELVDELLDLESRAGYLVEITIYTGQRLLSDTVEQLQPALGIADTYRWSTMVEEVSVIATHTGEVVFQADSFAVIASRRRSPRV